MQAGIEMDQLIAEHVMGWIRRDTHPCQDQLIPGFPAKGPWFWHPDYDWPKGHMNGHTIPHFSSDLNAAFDVVKVLLQKFLIEKRIANAVSPTVVEPSTSFSISYSMHSERECSQPILMGPYVEMTIQDRGVVKVLERGESIPHAICLAAIAAFGIDV